MTPGNSGIRRLEKRNWESILFALLTTLLLCLAVLTLVFPGVLDELQRLRSEGDLNRYTGLLILMIMIYCAYVLRMQAQLGRMRRQLMGQDVHSTILEKLVGQFRRLMYLALVVHLDQPLKEKLEVLVAAAREAMEAGAVSLLVRRGGSSGPLVTAGSALLSEDQVAAVADSLKDSAEPIKAERPGQLSALLGAVPQGLRALLALPLPGAPIGPDKGPGVLLAEFSTSDTDRSAELELLRIFAENALIAIDNDALVRKIEHMAITDELTGIYNRRYFNEELNREVRRAERTGKPFSILIFDLDRFKQINDTYGHGAGDETLRRAAQCLSAGSRKSNMMARYGGEEFAALLIETDTEGAMLGADRMRQNIESLDGLPRKITVSIGVAVFPHHGRTITDLLKGADAALYVAKNAGRNQVRLAEAPAISAPA